MTKYATDLQDGTDGQCRSVTTATEGLNQDTDQTWPAYALNSLSHSAKRPRRQCLHGNFPAYYVGRRAFCRSHNCSSRGLIRPAQRSPSVCSEVSDGSLSASAVYLQRRVLQRHTNSTTDTRGFSLHAVDPRLDALVLAHGKFLFEGKDVLDVGCNAGALCFAIAGLLHAKRVVGLDIDDELVQLANAAGAKLRDLALRPHSLEAKAAASRSIDSEIQGIPDIGHSNPAPSVKEDDVATRGETCLISAKRRKISVPVPLLFATDDRDKKCKVEGNPAGVVDDAGGPRFQTRSTTRKPHHKGKDCFSRLLGPVLWNALVKEATAPRENGIDPQSLDMPQDVQVSEQWRDVLQPAREDEDCGVDNSPQRSPSSVPATPFPFNVSFGSCDIVEGLPPPSCPALGCNECSCPACFTSSCCEAVRRVQRAARMPPLSLAPSLCSFDVILCLSVTKWIHLHQGDGGILLLFSRLHAMLKAGGILLLEPQDWASYRRARRLSSAFKEQLRRIRLPPKLFTSVLTMKTCPTSHISGCSMPCAAASSGEETTCRLLPAGTPHHTEGSRLTYEDADSIHCSCCCISSLSRSSCDGLPPDDSAERAEQPFMLLSSLDPWSNDGQHFGPSRSHREDDLAEGERPVEPGVLLENRLQSPAVDAISGVDGARSPVERSMATRFRFAAALSRGWLSVLQGAVDPHVAT
ncbi:bicoid-interacting protein BIN3 [Besnoitia besnoiti]|uniref:RNA methyltransferase n=1 Tax=Besnoitia besnoiti TaxID=94643 RepID=A0A2A9MNL5_BESBE|nr:bicoid-interacting protein BIN3 [Besnoitia besnoiti]PFH37282.1 bicoid-interacting protein BIN3 [Besnoitia besnoiti]